MVTRFPAFAKALTLAILSFPRLASAQEGSGTTGADVLAWTEAQQDSFFQISVAMVGIVATQVDGREHIADCINGWYGGGDASQPQRSARIREVMQAMPQHHPQVIVLAVIEDVCAEF